MENFAVYGYAIASMSATALFGLLINPITALLKLMKGLPSGATPPEDYKDGTYRLNRAYLNLSEVMGFFVAVTVAAMFAGVDPGWVNSLALIFLVSRILHFVVHIAGVGPMNFGPRTVAFVIGYICMILMGFMAITAVL